MKLYVIYRHTYMYSIVPQKVCVKQFSNTASLHKPKSVNTTCPVKRNGPQGIE